MIGGRCIDVRPATSFTRQVHWLIGPVEWSESTGANQCHRGAHPMKSRKLSGGRVVTGQCLCGTVQFEMEYPAFWAWHDHSRASRLAHGAVYATYVGTWRKRFCITAGESEISRFEAKTTGDVRSFCRRCGTPLIYERRRSRHMINIPRALFQSRTGRQPIYHIALEEMQDWAYAGEPLVPLKGYPGVFWKRSKKKPGVQEAGIL